MNAEEKNHRELLGILPDIIMRFDADCRHTFVSENVSEAVDISAGNFINKTHRELGFPEEKCILWEKAIKGVFETGNARETDFLLDSSSGTKVFNWRLVPEYSQDGKVSSVLSIARDITKHRQMETDHRDLFNKMLNAFALSELIYDEQGKPVDFRFLQANPAFEGISGLKPDDIINKFASEVMPSFDREWLEIYDRVVKTGRSEVFERYSVAFNKYLIVSVYCCESDRFAAMFRDVTENRRSQQRLRDAIDSSPFPVAVVDEKDEQLEHFSRSAIELFGHNPGSVAEWYDLAYPDPDYRAEVSAQWRPAVEKARATGSVVNAGEYQITCADGSVLTCEIYVNFIKGNMIVTFQDVTKLKEAEKEREKAHEQNVHQERLGALGQMASGIAHDFNNVLMPIVGLTALLIENPDDFMDDKEELVSILKQVNEAAEDARQIVRRLRTIHKPDTSDALQHVDIEQIIKSAVNLSKPRWKEQKSAEGYRISLQSKLEKIRQPIMGNPSELREAMLNLLLNAVDAMPEGGELNISCKQEPHWAVITVQDTGTGMTREQIQKCVEPFFSTKGAQGTGLGLAMVSGIVERHNGSLQIDSNPGKGTRIQILLPFAESRSREKEPEPVDMADLSEMNIVVVDDDERSLRLTAAMLGRDGHTVTSIESGKEALEYVRDKNNSFDLIICDRAMGEVNGDKVLAASKECRPDIPAILLTGFGGIMNDAGELPAGVDKVMSKPVTRQELRDMIRKCCAQRGADTADG